MDVKKLLEIGGAVESKGTKRIKGDEFLEGIDELEEVASKGKINVYGEGIKISKREDVDAFSVFIGSQGESEDEIIEARRAIVYWIGNDRKGWYKDDPYNFVSFLFAAGNTITVEGKRYEITKPEKFARAFYEGIKNEPTTFETMNIEEPALEKYLPGNERKQPTIKRKRPPYEPLEPDLHGE